MSFEWCIETHDTVPSTQDLLKNRVQEGSADEGFVLQAMKQDAGYGRHGRDWVSPPGNLYLSMVLEPDCRPRDLGQLSLLASLVLAQTVDVSISARPALKWPNDLLIDGRKCAGLLLETSLNEGGVEWVVLGVGVNIASAPTDIGACLNDFSTAPVDINVFRDAFLTQFKHSYEVWLAQGFDMFGQQWLDYAHPKGTAISVKIAAQLEKGYFHDIDAHGNLRLRKDDGIIKTIGAGDVYLYDDVSDAISD